MNIPGINVFARFKAKAGQEDAVRRALLDMIEPTLNENENIGYALHVSTDDPTAFVLYEQWNDKAALDRHMGQPYFKEMETKLDGALAQPMEVVTMHMICGETAPTAAGTGAAA